MNPTRILTALRSVGCLSLLLAALLSSWPAQAATVSPEQAQLAAERWLAACPAPLGAKLLKTKAAGDAIGKVEALNPTKGAIAGYVISLKPEGYLIVTADTRMEPIVAFSQEGAYDPKPENPLVALLSLDLPARLAAVTAKDAAANPLLTAATTKNEAAWADLLSKAVGANVVTEEWVPFFVQSRWSQSTEGGRACYNYYTPLIGDNSYTIDPGNPSNMVSGCAATATAQVIRYFAWPEAGIGTKLGSCSITFYDQYAVPNNAVLPAVQLRGGNGSGGPYDWANMTLDPDGSESEHSLQQIGALCSDAGLSINMSYNAARSSMSAAGSSPTSFKNSFNYAGASSAGGMSGMRANLDARRPVTVGIELTNPLLPPPGGGHCTVGDGYGRIDGRWYYHLNMGWGGSSDLWYNVEEYFYAGAGGGEWGGFGPSVGNIYRKSLQPNEDAINGMIISGRITDAAGNPVPGVQAKIQQGGSDFLKMMVWNEPSRDYSDARGIWAIDKVPAGTYTIVLSKDGLEFSGPVEVTVGASNQWGLNFTATAGNALSLQDWWYDNTLVPGTSAVILEFNRPLGTVSVDPGQLAINGYALDTPAAMVLSSEGSPYVIIVLNAADIAQLDTVLTPPFTLTMARAFLIADVDGQGTQFGEDDAATIPVAPLITSGAAENTGSPANPTAPHVAETRLLLGSPPALVPPLGSPHATTAAQIQFLAHFTLPVTAVDPADFHLHITSSFTDLDGVSSGSGPDYAAKLDTPVPTASITSVQAADATYSPAATTSSEYWLVTVQVGQGDGFIRLDVIDDDSITASGTPLGGAGSHNGDYLQSPYAFHVDNLGPVIVAATLDPSNTYVTITWNEPVGGSATTRLESNDLAVLLKRNDSLGGTVTGVSISAITDKFGNPLAPTALVNEVRAYLSYTPPLDAGGAVAPTFLNEYRVPAGVETIEIVPVEDSVFDALSNLADTQTTTGQMKLYDSAVPRVVDVVLADDNYSARVTFSERVYTTPDSIGNLGGIANHRYDNFIPTDLRIGNLKAVDFVVTVCDSTGAVLYTIPLTNDDVSQNLGTYVCNLNFNNYRANIDPGLAAPESNRNNIVVQVVPLEVFDFHRNAVPATSRTLTMRPACPALSNPIYAPVDSLPPTYFTSEADYRRASDDLAVADPATPFADATPNRTGPAPGTGLDHYGIYYRDLDGDCRVDAVDLNFANPNPRRSVTYPTYSLNGVAPGLFRVWVQNNDPEDNLNKPNTEGLPSVTNWPFTSNWTEISITGASVIANADYYSTVRVTINQTQVRARTHGKRWVLISYADPSPGSDGLAPYKDYLGDGDPDNANTDDREKDQIHWFWDNPDADNSDHIYIVDSFAPIMAWDGAPARPVSATMWRVTNYTKQDEADYNSYDYMDVVFSEPVSSVTNGNWSPVASYGEGANVHQKDGPYGPEIRDLLSGERQTVRLWFNNNDVISRAFSGTGGVIDNSPMGGVTRPFSTGRTNGATPSFSGIALAVRPLDSRYRVLGFSDDNAWVDMLQMDAEGAHIQQGHWDTGALTSDHLLHASSITLRGHDQGGFNPNSDAYWRRSDGPTFLLAGNFTDNLGNVRAARTFSAAANNAHVTPGDAFVAGVDQLVVYNANLANNSLLPVLYTMKAPAVLQSGPVYAMAKVSPVVTGGTSRLGAPERAVLGIDAAGLATDVIDTITVRVVDTSYGQFDPEVDLLPLADDATSGVRLYKTPGGVPTLVQLAAGGLEWSAWHINDEGHPYREVVLRPLGSQGVPHDDDPANGNAGFEYEIRVVTNVNFNLGDSFYAEIPDHGILFRRARSSDDFASGWDTQDGTSGLALTDHVYRDANADGRWGMAETILDIEDAFAPVPFYDAGVSYAHRDQGPALLSVIRDYQRNMYYAKRGASPNPDTRPEPAGATGDDTIDTDYNVVYSPGDDVWYDIGGKLGVYDAGIDIPVVGNSDQFQCGWSPHEEGARSVQVRGAVPASVSAIPGGSTISAGSAPTAVLGIDMHDSGRAFEPRHPFGVAAGILVEAVSSNLRGQVYSAAIACTLDPPTLSWRAGTPVNVSALGRYLLADPTGDTFIVVDVTGLPAAAATSSLTISADNGRGIRQPAAIRGVRIHAVGPGNVPGLSGTLRLNGSSLSWQSGPEAPSGLPVDVTAGGMFVLNAERVSPADYLVVQVGQIHGATSEELPIYEADGRDTTPLQAITGMEIVACSDPVNQGTYRFTWDGSASLTWGDGIPTHVAGTAGTLTIVPGSPDGTAFVVVRRTAESLPAVPAEDYLFLNQTRLLRLALSVTDQGGFTSTHLAPLTNAPDSGIALYRDANANGVFDGPTVDEFVPLIAAPAFAGAGTYTLTLAPDPAARVAHLPRSHVTPASGNDYFIALQTTYDISYGDRFSVYASVYEPTEPDAALAGYPTFAAGDTGVVTCTSVTNTVYVDATSAPWNVDAGTAGVAAPLPLFGVDHFLGANGTIYLQSVTFSLRSVSGLNPAVDLMALDHPNQALRGIMLYADTDQSGTFSPGLDTLIACDIATTYDDVTGTYTITLLPMATSPSTLVPVASDGGRIDHFVCLNLSPGLDYGDEFYGTAEVGDIYYSSGKGNAASRLRTHNLKATVPSRYNDLTTRTQTTLTAGLVINDIGSAVPDGYQQVSLGFDPTTRTYSLTWNGYTVSIDPTAIGTYTLGVGNAAITVTFDPFAFFSEDLLVDGDGTATAAPGTPSIPLDSPLLALYSSSAATGASGQVYYVDHDASASFSPGDALVLAGNSGLTYDGLPDQIILGSASPAAVLVPFAPSDRLGFYDASADGAYGDGEDIVRDTDGLYTLPSLDQILDTDGPASTGVGPGSVILENALLTSAATVSLAPGTAVTGLGGLYYYDADASQSYTLGDDLIVRPAVGGIIPGPLSFVPATDQLISDGDDLWDGDDADPADEVQVAAGDPLSLFVSADYVAFESGGAFFAGYEAGEDVFRSADQAYNSPDFSWTFRVTNGTRTIRRYEPAAPFPFNDPEDAMTPVLGLDVANSGATDITIDRLTVRFFNDSQFNATTDLRSLTTGATYADRDAGVLLYRDADGNGLLDPLIDTLIPLAEVPAWTTNGNEYRLTFAPASANLVDDVELDGIYDFFVVVQPDSDANNWQRTDNGDRFHALINVGDLVLSKQANVMSVLGDTVTIDSLPPQLTVDPDTNDADADGHLDSVVFTFHENLLPAHEDAADWSLTDADGSTDLSPTDDAQIALAAGYRILTITLADDAGTTGRITCRTQYDPDRLGLFDWAGNPVDLTPAGRLTADDVPPRLALVETGDRQPNGLLDHLYVTFSETVDLRTLTNYVDPVTPFTAGGWTFGTYADLRIDPQGHTSGTRLLFTFTEASLGLGGGDTGAKPTLRVVPNSIRDLAGNGLPAQSLDAADTAAPIPVDAFVDRGLLADKIQPGTVLKVVFSETILDGPGTLALGDILIDRDGPDAGLPVALDALGVAADQITLSVANGALYVTFLTGPEGFSETATLNLRQPAITPDSLEDAVGLDALARATVVPIRALGSVQIVALETLDADLDGYLDYARVTFNRAIRDSTLDVDATPTGPWVLTNLAGGAVRADLAADLDGPDGSDLPDDTILYLSFREATQPDTGAQLQLAVNNSALLSANDEPFAEASFTVASIDKALPQIMDVTTDDADGNGRVDTAILRGSETMDPAGVNPADFTIGGNVADAVFMAPLTSVAPATAANVLFSCALPHYLAVGDRVMIIGPPPASYDGTYTVTAVPGPTEFELEHAYIAESVAGGAAIAAGDKLILTLAGANQVAGTEYKPVDYTPGTLADPAGNPLAAMVNAGLRSRTDLAKPCVASARTLSDRDLEVTFTEPVTNIQAGDLKTDSDTLSFDSVATLNPSAHVWSLNASTWNTDATGMLPGAAASTDSTGVHRTVLPDLSIEAGRINDLVGNTNVAVVNLNDTADNAAPVAIQIVLRDDFGGAPDGSVDTATVTFSEPMSGASIAASLAAFKLGGIPITGPLGPFADDAIVTLTHAGVAGTDPKALDYEVPSGTVVDLRGNPLAAGTNIGLLQSDQASPVVVSARTRSDNSIEVTFSEALNPASVDPADLSAGLPGNLVTFTDPPTVAANTVTWLAASQPWNTDADGTHAGNGTDSTGLVSTVIPQISLAAGAVTDLATSPNGNLGLADYTLVADGAAPIILRVDSTRAPGIYTEADLIPLRLHLSEVVQVTGTPSLGLNVGLGSAFAVGYSSGTGTNTLVFNYTVGADHNRITPDFLNVWDANALSLPDSSAIKDASLAANDANLALPTAGANALTAALIELDNTPPSIATAATVDHNTLRVSFSEPLDNSADAIATNVPQVGILDGAAAFVPFLTVSADAAGLVPLSDALTYTTLYYHMDNLAGPFWNTDATGTSAGVGTDHAGVSQAHVPAVQIQAGALRDRVSTAILAANFTATTDGAPPVPVALAYRDNGADGSVDRVALTYSEALVLPTDFLASWAITPNDLTGLGTAALAATAEAPRVVVLTVAATTALTGVPLAGAEPQVTYTHAAAQPLQDIRGNTAASFGPAELTDAAGPALVSARMVSRRTVEMTLSEAVDDGTQAAGDFALGSFASNAISAALTGDNANDRTLLVIKTTEAAAAETGTVALSAAAVLADSHGVPSAQVDSVTVAPLANLIRVTSPAPNAVFSQDVHGAITLVGSAAARNMSSWTLYYAVGTNPAAPDLLEFKRVAGTPAAAIVAGDLGTWDMAAMPDGTYTLRLRVVMDDPTAAGWGLDETPVDVDIPVTLDATVATVIAVTVTEPSGTYSTAQDFHIQVTFSEPIIVACSGGTPYLELNTTPPQRALYVGGSGSAVLQFLYTVQDGDATTDLDYLTSSSLQPDGCTLRDGAENDAILDLPTPGSPQSIGGSKNIIIDTTGPALLLYSPTRPLPTADAVTYSYTPGAASHAVPIHGRALADDIAAAAAPVNRVEVSADGNTWFNASLDPVDGVYTYALNLLNPIWGDHDLITPYQDGLYTITVRAWDTLNRSTQTTVPVWLRRDAPTADLLMPPQDAWAMRGTSHRLSLLVQAPYLAGTQTQWTLEGKAGDDDFSSGAALLTSGTTAATYTATVDVPMPATGDAYYVRLHAVRAGNEATAIHRFRLHDGIRAVETVDANANGRLDGIRLTFDAPVDIVDWDDATHGIEHALTVTGYSVTPRDYSASSVTSLLLTLVEKAANDTHVTPDISYVDNHTVLFAATVMPFVPDYRTTATDAAAPILISAESRSDRSIAVTFSEPIDILTVHPTDLSVVGATDFASVAPDGSNSVLLWTAVAPAWNTDATGAAAGTGTDSAGAVHTIALQLTIGAAAFADAAGNAFAGVGAYTGTYDHAPPALVSARTISDRALDVRLSEAVSGVSAADLRTQGGTVAFSGYSALDALTHRWSAAATPWNTDATGLSAGAIGSTDSTAITRTGTPDVTVAAAAFHDLPANPVEAISGWTGTADGAAPIALTATYLDLVADAFGQTHVDSVTVRLSEPVALDEYEDADWSTAADPGSIGLGNESAVTALQHTVTLTVLGALNLTGGALAPTVRYVRTAGLLADSLHDAVANPAADFALQAQDGAAPCLIAARYLDLNYDAYVDHVEATFSETVRLNNTLGWSLLAMDLALDPASLGAPVLAANQTTVSFTVSATAPETGVYVAGNEQQPVLTVGSAASLVDLSPAAWPLTLASVPVADAAGPVLLSAKAATQTVIQVAFSERLDGASVVPADFSHDTQTVIGVAALDDWAGARLTLAAPVPWGSAAARVAFRAAAVVVDPWLNPNGHVALVTVTPLLQDLIYLSGPAQDLIHRNDTPVTGRCDVANGVPADDLLEWRLFLVQGQGTSRLPVSDPSTVLIASSPAPLTPAGTFADLRPSLHATPGIYSYTLVLQVAFNTGEPALDVYRAIFAAADIPLLGTVNDGPAADVDLQASTTTLSANWSGFTNGVLPPVSYIWAAGTDADADNGMEIFDWTAVGNSTAASRTGLTLTHGSTYYVFVRALDGAGNPIGRNLSDGVRIDALAPTAGTVSDGALSAVDLDYQQSSDRVAATWQGFADDPGGSGIAKYQWAIFRRLGDTQAPATDTLILPWEDAGNGADAASLGTGTLLHAQPYYAGVRAVDAVGNVGAPAYSDGFRPDLLAPVTTLVRDGLAADIDMIHLPTELSGNWDPFTEPDSGLNAYQYRLVTDVSLITAGWESRTTPDQGALLQGRTRFGVAHLADGRIMVIGGWTGVAALATVEIYNPATGAWTSTGSLQQARYGAAVVALPDGDVIVAGGSNGSSYLGSIERYDHLTASWNQIASLSVPRDNAAAALMADGSVWIAGGRGAIDPLAPALSGYRDLVESLNPPTNTVGLVGYLSQPRAGAAAYALNAGGLVIFGGETVGAVPSAVTDIYQPGFGWSASSLSTARANFATAQTPDGDLLALGGTTAAGAAMVKTNSVERLDAATLTWSPAASMSTPRASFGAAWVESTGTVLVSGGINATSVFVKTSEEYNPDLDLWTPSTALNRNRGYHALVSCSNGLVMALGGLADWLITAETEVRRFAAPVSAWQAAVPPTSTSGTVSGLALELGRTYYVQVRAFDNVGNRSAIATSDGVLVSTFSTPPVVVTLVGPATATVGESFDLMLYVREDNPDAQGFRGGPLDLTFTASRAQVTVPDGFSPAAVLATPFTAVGVAQTSGTLDNTIGLIDELGGATTADHLGEGAAPGILYATIPFRATAPGVCTIAASPGLSGLVLTPPIGVVPTEFANYGAALNITIFQGVTLTVVDDVLALNEGGSYRVRASLPVPATEPVTVGLALAGSATLGTDYAVAGLPLVIPAGTTSATVTIQTVDDGVREDSNPLTPSIVDPETITVSIASVTSASGGYAEVDEQSATVALLDSGRLGDADGDNDVDYYDLLELISEYGMAHPGPDDLDSDFDGDGDVDYYDLLILIANYGGTKASASVAATGTKAVEPSATITLVGPATVAPGATFAVDVYVQVSDPRGFGGGVLDLDFSTATVDYSGAFTPGTIIQAPFNSSLLSPASLNEAAGRVIELGGGTIVDGLGYAAPVHYARLNFTAMAAGTATFVASAGTVELRLVGGTIPFTNVTYAAPLSVSIATPNRAPTAAPASAQTALDHAADITLAGTDPDGDPLTFVLPTIGQAAYPAHGTLSNSRPGTLPGTRLVTYTPDLGYSGADTFAYSVSDGALSSLPATVDLSIGGFLADLVVTQSGGAPFTALRFGTQPGASDHFVLSEGDYLATPPLLNGGSAHLLAPYGELLAMDIRDTNTESQWKLALTVPGSLAGDTWNLAWQPAALPAESLCFLTPADATWTPVGAAIDMKAVSSQTLANHGATATTLRFLLTVATEQTVTLALKPGWNLIGIPLTLDPESRDAFLGDERIIALYQYSSATGYLIPANVTPGRAYWAYASTAFTLELSGVPAPAGVSLSYGWNLVAPQADSPNPLDGITVLAVWAWDPSVGYYIPGLDESTNILSTVGVWVFAAHDAIIWEE